LAKLPAIVFHCTGAVRADDLVFDFESGDLQSWHVVSGAFEKPVCEYRPNDKRRVTGGVYFLTRWAGEPGYAVHSGGEEGP